MLRIGTMTDHRHQPGRWALTCWLLLALCGCTGVSGTSGSGGSCAAPWLSTLPNATFSHPGPGLTERDALAVSPGQELRVYGHWYQTCQDTNNQPISKPFMRIKVIITQGHSRQALAIVSAHMPNGRFVITVHLPHHLRHGPATVETSQPVEGPLFLEVR
jgi:hypothetical protein